MKRNRKSSRGPRLRLGPGAMSALVLLGVAAAVALTQWRPWEPRASSPPPTGNDPSRSQSVGASNAPAMPPEPTNDVATLIEEGNDLLKAGTPEKAIAAYQRALKLNAEDEDIWFNLGLANARLGNVEEARRCYGETLRLLPDYPEVHTALGNLEMTLRRLTNALDHYAAALKIRPDDSVTLSQLGTCLAQLGRTDQALTNFAAAIQLNPDYFEARFNLASAQLRLGRYDPAIEEFERVLKMQPGFRPALEGLERAKGKKAALNSP